ncbi:hypothetical protein JJ691_65720 [Kutzneria sp. CA-103260]|nr:hypothetical protein JJ691_65720 [Kutzneria sp. CA-103260]
MTANHTIQPAVIKISDKELIMSTLVESIQTTHQTVIVRPTSLADTLAEIKAKREADLIRFRTCCADPRASK